MEGSMRACYTTEELDIYEQVALNKSSIAQATKALVMLSELPEHDCTAWAEAIAENYPDSKLAKMRYSNVIEFPAQNLALENLWRLT
jgi:hypothetical protein